MKSMNQKIAFALSLLVHAILLLLIFYSFQKTKLSRNAPITLEISLIDSSKKSQQKVTKTSEKFDKLENKKTSNASTNQHFHDDQFAENFSSQQSQNIAPQYNPLPKIPDDLRAEAFHSEAIARFYIDQFGNVEKVELIKPCANPRLNNLLLKTLRQWKFAASKQASTQDVKVKFSVQ